MVEEVDYIKIPVGELLRELHDKGFSITPEIYSRVFFVVNEYNKHAASSQPYRINESQEQELIELLCPIVSRNEIEQEKFSLIFNDVIIKRAAKGIIPKNENDSKPNKVLTVEERRLQEQKDKAWRIISCFILLLILSFFFYSDSNLKDSSIIRKDSSIIRKDSSIINPNDYTLLPPKPATYSLELWRVILVFIVVSFVVSWLMYWFFYHRNKAKHNNDPPYNLIFPKQEHEIKPSTSLQIWTRQLQQREEGTRRELDIKNTIQATIKRGGFPEVAYKQTKSRPHYLLLIDHRSAFDQQTKLFDYVATLLLKSDIDIDIFFFHTTPNYCWSEKYPQGIHTKHLHDFYSSSYLILITEGFRLIDYQKHDVALWVTNIFSGWTKRAILTPIYPSNWNYIEVILSRFFIVLPATPDGQLLLKKILQHETIPTFVDIKSYFNTNPTASNVSTRRSSL